MDEQSLPKVPKAVIVLAEDHKALLDGIAELLMWDVEKYEIEVCKAENGRIAFDLMQTVTPDLIISDRMMPEMDGEQFFHAVRDKLEWLDIPFIFLTAAGAPQAILEGWIMGVDKYIIKPFDDDSLVETVGMLLDDFFNKRDARNEKTRREKAAVLEAMGHEFRTPLTLISLMQEILGMFHEASEDPMEVIGFLDDIAKGNQRFHRLVTNVIMSHGLRTGKLHNTLSKTATKIENPSQLLQASWKEFSENIGKYSSGCLHLDKITFTADIPNTLPPIFGVSHELEYIIIHLLENALKFIDKAIAVSDDGKQDGHFTLVAHHDSNSDELCITITDNGLGFSMNIMSQLFLPYYQWQRDYYQQQGAGLGLSLVKGIVKMHNGRLRAVSEGKNTGAEFSLTLPICTNKNENLSKKLFGNNANVQESTILIAEDDKQIQELLCDLLSMYQTEERVYNVITADDGLQALKLLEEQAIPDLIISDISMPNMDGLEFIRQVKQNPEWLHIPVMFLTAFPKEEIDLQNIPVNDYIVKPFQPDELLTRIATRLKRHHKIEETLRAAVAHITSSMFVSLESEFLPTINFNLERTATLKSAIDKAQSLDDAQLRTQISDYLKTIKAKCVQMKHFINTYLKLLDLSNDAILVDEIEHVVHPDPGQLIYEALSKIDCDPSYFDNLKGCEQIKIVHEKTVLPSMVDFPSVVNGEATNSVPAISFVMERLVHFVLSHALPDPTVVVNVLLNSDDHNLYVRVCTPRSKLEQEQIELLALYLENMATAGSWGSDLMLGRVYSDLFKGEIGLAYSNEALTLTMVLPISDCVT